MSFSKAAAHTLAIFCWQRFLRFFRCELLQGTADFDAAARLVAESRLALR